MSACYGITLHLTNWRMIISHRSDVWGVSPLLPCILIPLIDLIPSSLHDSTESFSIQCSGYDNSSPVYRPKTTCVLHYNTLQHTALLLPPFAEMLRTTSNRMLDKLPDGRNGVSASPYCGIMEWPIIDVDQCMCVCACA
jgi:hypothetical protein